MAARLSDEVKLQDLTSLLKVWNFKSKYFIQPSGKGSSIVFAIAYKDEDGHTFNSTGFYSYVEMQRYIWGVGQSKQFLD